MKVSWFFRISAVALLALIVAVASLAGGYSDNALAATGTAPASKLPFALCKAPTPTPEPSPTKGKAATKAATAAATMAATMSATMSATMASTMSATMAATMSATKAATMAATAAPPTAIPPTATTLPVGLQPASALIVLRLNKKLLLNGKPCVEVQALTAGGPADAAGIKVGDLILGFDKTPITALNEFQQLVDKKKSGDKVLVTVQRGSDEIAFSVTLGLNPFANPNATAASTGAATSAATKAATPAATKAK